MIKKRYRPGNHHRHSDREIVHDDEPRLHHVTTFVKQVAYIGPCFGLNLRNMVKTFSLYEASTGLFTGKRLQCDEDALLEVRLPPGTLTLEGAYDHMSQRVDMMTGCVVAYYPLAPTADHEWNAASKRWHVPQDLRAQADGRRAEIFARIHALETSQGRAIREATLGDPAALKRLREIDAEITTLRAELQ
jgi:hypothetical protein